MCSEKLITSKKIFNGRSVALRVDTIKKPSGIQTTREIVEHKDCVAVVPLDDENNVIMVEQFRTPIGKKLLEIPAGSIESGEDPFECVKRELQEEIGYIPGKIISLGGIYAAPGYCTEYLHLFLAKDLRESRLIAEDTDEIEIIRVPLSKIQRLIKAGKICDAKSICGLLRVIMEKPE